MRRSGCNLFPPELRENMGEIECRRKKVYCLNLVEEKDVQGLFHIHTNFSDGTDTLESIVRRQKKWD